MAFQILLQEGLLRVRLAYEERERMRLKELFLETRRTTEQKAAAETQLQALRRETENLLQKGTMGSEHHFTYSGIGVQQHLIATYDTKLSELQARLRRQRVEFRQARQKREIVQSLRQKQWDLYHLAQARRFQQAADDLYLMRRGSRVTG